ncbi:MAG: hemerythrin domain-containing protein [Acidobacteriota bacterium]
MTTLTASIHRFNIYQSVHKGLRAFMSDTLTRVGATDERDADECQDTGRQVRALLALCASHLEHENRFIHTAMERRSPGSAGQCANEHVQHLDHIARLQASVTAAQEASGTERAGAWQWLYQQLSLFVAENFEHMLLEEREHNAVLWSHYSDAEIHEIHEALVSSVPADEMALNFRWMIPQLTHSERLAMLSGMRQGMPEHVFGAQMGVARGLLSDRAWRKLASALPVGEVCHG